MPVLAEFKAHFALCKEGCKSVNLAPTACGGVIMAMAFTGSVHAAAPVPWQMDLQPPAGSMAEMATDLHNLLLVIITLISLFVLGLLIYVSVRFRESRNPNPTKTSHNTVIEILWTVIPVLILVGIAIPSFRLLYYMDRTNETVIVTTKSLIKAGWEPS